MQHMPHLDGLRAFAITAVLVEHFGGATLNALIPIGAGPIGVNLFFSLSGFLITSILLNSLDKNRERNWTVLLNFYARRFLRLMPVFYATLFILVLLNIGTLPESWPWHASYLSNVYIALGGEKSVFWSLAVEEQFYLAWPFLIVLTPRRYLLHATIAVVLAALAWKIGAYVLDIPKVAANVLLPGNLEAIGLGCILAIICYRDGNSCQFGWYSNRAASGFTMAAWTSLGLAMLSWSMLGENSFLRYFTNDLLMATFYMWIVFQGARGCDGIAGRVLSLAAVQFLGRISYGVYVVHNWVPDVLEKFAGPLPKMAAGPIVLFLTIAICGASWYCFEQPLMRLKRLFREQSVAVTLGAVGAGRG